MLFEQAGEFIINKLRAELPAHLTYHHVNHTLDVYRAARSIASQEGIDAAPMKLLLTAAWFHDSGFLIGAEEHEEHSCQIARRTLPGFEYTKGEIDIICELISATKVPQLPHSHLGQILADTDLDYLGRDDFWTISDSLYQELLFAGKIDNKNDWDYVQIKFMEQHHFFTKTSINSRKAQKEINLAQIRIRINNQK